MNWVINKLNVTESSIFTLSNTDIKIHKIAGYDDWLFLTYRPLEIEWHELNTQDFNEAKKKAVEYIQHTMQTLCNKVEVDKNKLIQAIVEPDTFSRY